MKLAVEQKLQLTAHRCRGASAFSTRAPRIASRIACRAQASDSQQHQEPSFLQRFALSLAAAATAALPLTAITLDVPPPAHALLTAGDPIKNAQAILRYALPIDCKPIRNVQRELEGISESLRIPGSKSLGPIARAVRSSKDIITKQKSVIVGKFAADKKEAGLAALAKLEQSLDEFQALIEAKDKQEVPIKQREALSYVGGVEEAMVSGFPFEVPKEYADRPLLLGRATLDMKVHVNETPSGPQDVPLTIVLDGYNAPVSAGNFADLVLRKFYDGMEVQRADGFVVQTGDPEGPEDGFVDPASGQIRRVPFEIRVVGEQAPVYDFTLEDLGRYNEQPVLPFNAYGTLAVARAEFENNSGSSQVFFLLKESELTPSGANLLDGRYAVFGYVTEGQDALGYMHVGDKIEYIKLVDGQQNLKNAYKQ